MESFVRHSAQPSGLDRLLAEERRLEEGLARLAAEREERIAQAVAEVDAERERLDAGWSVERGVLIARGEEQQRRLLARVREEAQAAAARLDATSDEEVRRLAYALLSTLIRGEDA